jgi:hypothetical protein
MTDEARFHLSDCVNKQNFHYWADENPQQLHQRPLHSAHVTVWCGVANFGVTVPYFFENKDGRPVTVTSACYVEILWNFLIPELSCCGTELMTIWFWQDSATAAHTARASIEVILGNVSGACYFTAQRAPWPAHSLDLSACDYFLWGYFKAKVCTLEENFSDTRKHGKESTGKPESKAGRVCTQRYITS